MKKYRVVVRYDDVIDERIIEANGACGAVMVALMSLPSQVGSIYVKASVEVEG